MATIKMLKAVKGTPLKKDQVIEGVDCSAALSMVKRKEAIFFVEEKEPVK